MNEQTQKLLTTIAENVPKAKQQGYDEGEKSGYDKGIIALWDAKTNKGKIDVGNGFFNQGNYDEIEELPYPIVIKDSCERMFYNYMGKILPRPQYVDLSQLPTGSSTLHMFGYCGVANDGYPLTVPDYGLPAMNNYYNSFSSSNIETITVLRTRENTLFSTPSNPNLHVTFERASKLRNITFEGVIGRNISFSSSPLSVESIKSVITHLKNYTETDREKYYTLTLKSSCKTKLETAGFTDEDKTWLSENGITYSDNLTWIDVIDDLKWNLVWAS